MVVTEWIKAANMTAGHPKSFHPFTRWIWGRPLSTARIRPGMVNDRWKKTNAEKMATKAASLQSRTGACSGSFSQTTSPVWASSTLCLRSLTWLSTLSSRRCLCPVTAWTRRPSCPLKKRPSSAGQSSSHLWRTLPPASLLPASPQKMLPLHKGSGPLWNWKHTTDQTESPRCLHYISADCLNLFVIYKTVLDWTELWTLQQQFPSCP